MKIEHMGRKKWKIMKNVEFIKLQLFVFHSSDTVLFY